MGVMQVAPQDTDLSPIYTPRPRGLGSLRIPVASALAHVTGIVGRLGPLSWPSVDYCYWMRVLPGYGRMTSS